MCGDQVEQIEILMEIREDIAEIKAYNVDVQRRISLVETTLEKRDTRLRRVEFAILPISAAIGWVAMNITDFLNK